MRVVTLDSADIARELELRDDVYVTEVDGEGEEALVEAGVEDADVLVVSGGANAVQIPVAKHVNPDLRTILVGDDAPDYVRATVDLILSPEIADAETVAGVVRDG